MSKNKKTRHIKKEVKDRIIILSIVVLISLVICGVIVYKYKASKSSKEEAVAVKVDDTIEGYGYQLKDSATQYYKDLFNRLKTLLANDNPDEKEYATLVSQMFAADFYNLDNKVTSSDIGGTQFISTDFQDNFNLAAQNSIYKSVKSNIYGDRTQDLPIVTEVTVNSVLPTKYTYDKNTDSQALDAKITIKYQKELDYPVNVELILIHNDKKLEIAKVD